MSAVTQIFNLAEWGEFPKSQFLPVTADINVERILRARFARFGMPQPGSIPYPMGVRNELPWDIAIKRINSTGRKAPSDPTDRHESERFYGGDRVIRERQEVP